MIHRDIWKVLKDVTDSEVKDNLSSSVASLDQVLDVFILSYELFLHCSPHNLTEKRKYLFWSFAFYLQQVLLLTKMLLHLLVEFL